MTQHVEILPIHTPSPNGRKRVLFRAQCECGFLSGHHLSIREARFAGRYHSFETHGFDNPIIVTVRDAPDQTDDDIVLNFDDDDDQAVDQAVERQAAQAPIMSFDAQQIRMSL